MKYIALYERQFVRNLKKYHSLRGRIKRCVDSVLADPYIHTEFLDDKSGNLNLKGCRSRRVDRNFRVIFVICEECRNISRCEYCFCEHLSDNNIIFLTVGPHDRAYSLK
uniref:Uncharacterized protein n=1 Tax=Candidatus Kentrum sp. DK TaxID=2126562 RepID=A0A450S6D8_9GAMM|nr:MAG: hypothetical protein BECKDK2373C_GA0170839_101832 [Candidatus Kentron sp. DK]